VRAEIVVAFASWERVKLRSFPSSEIAARLPQDPGHYADAALTSAEAITSTYFRALAYADLAVNQPDRQAHLVARALATARTAKGIRDLTVQEADGARRTGRARRPQVGSPSRGPRNA